MPVDIAGILLAPVALPGHLRGRVSLAAPIVMAVPVSVSAILLDVVPGHLREGSANCSTSGCTLDRSTHGHTEHAAHGSAGCNSLFGLMVSMFLRRICGRRQNAQRSQGQDNTPHGANL